MDKSVLARREPTLGCRLAGQFPQITKTLVKSQQANFREVMW